MIPAQTLHVLTSQSLQHQEKSINVQCAFGYLSIFPTSRDTALPIPSRNLTYARFVAKLLRGHLILRVISILILVGNLASAKFAVAGFGTLVSWHVISWAILVNDLTNVKSATCVSESAALCSVTCLQNIKKRQRTPWKAVTSSWHTSHLTAKWIALQNYYTGPYFVVDFDGPNRGYPML